MSPFTSLNMGLHVGDHVEDVLENRKRYFRALGIDESRLINCSQVHGTHIEKVSGKDCGRGALSLDTAIPDTDGLITGDSNVPLTMNYADCTPLFFYDPVKKAAALSHGGWRGTAGNIVGKTVDLRWARKLSMPCAHLRKKMNFLVFTEKRKTVNIFLPLQR